MRRHHADGPIRRQAAAPLRPDHVHRRGLADDPQQNGIVKRRAVTLGVSGNAACVIALGCALVAPQAMADPTPPSGHEVNQATIAEALAQGNLSRLINMVGQSDQKLANLQSNVSVQRESVNRALVDLQNATTQAVLARDAVGTADTNVTKATKKADAAQKEFDNLVRQQYMQGSGNTGLAQVLGSNADTTLNRAAVLAQLTADQRKTVTRLQTARNMAANRRSTAKASLAQANAAESGARKAKDVAEANIKKAMTAVQNEQRARSQVVSQRVAAQLALDAARSHATDVKARQQAYQRAIEEAAKKAASDQARAAAPQPSLDSPHQPSQGQTRVTSPTVTQGSQPGQWALSGTPQLQVGPNGLPDLSGLKLPTLGNPDQDAQKTIQQFLQTTFAPPKVNLQDFAKDPIGSIVGGLANGVNTVVNGVGNALGLNKLGLTGFTPSSENPTLTGQAAVEAVVARGMSQIGVPYAWGGGNYNGPTLGVHDGGVADAHGDYAKVGFDCSGLMMYAFAAAGVHLPHYSGYQYNAGPHVPLSMMKRGDMIFYGPGGGTHVALILGNGSMLEAPESGSTVHVSPVRTNGAMPYVVRMFS